MFPSDVVLLVVGSPVRGGKKSRPSLVTSPGFPFPVNVQEGKYVLIHKKP